MTNTIAPPAALIAKRQGIPTAVRRAVIERDGMVCTYCGIAVVTSLTHRDDRLHLDHVEPWAAGGLDTVENLVVSCAKCNLTKTGPRINLRATRPLVERRDRHYWWREDYTPPLPVGPHDCSVYLVDAISNYWSVDRIVSEVRFGLMAATGPGSPIAVVLPLDMSAPSRGPRRFRTRVEL